MNWVDILIFKYWFATLKKDRLQFYRMSVRFIDKTVVIFPAFEVKKIGFYWRAEYTSRCKQSSVAINTDTWKLADFYTDLKLQLLTKYTHMISENQEKLIVHVCNIPYSLSCSIFPVKISVFPLFIQSYWPVQTKIRQYVHWCNIVAVRLLTRAAAKLNQCVVFVFRLILVVTLYNGFTRYSIWIDNHCLAASLQPVSIDQAK